MDAECPDLGHEGVRGPEHSEGAATHDAEHGVQVHAKTSSPKRYLELR